MACLVMSLVSSSSPPSLPHKQAELMLASPIYPASSALTQEIAGLEMMESSVSKSLEAMKHRKVSRRSESLIGPDGLLMI